MSIARWGTLVVFVAVSASCGDEETPKMPKGFKVGSAAAITPSSPSGGALQPVAGGSVQSLSGGSIQPVPPGETGDSAAVIKFDCKAACNAWKDDLVKNFEAKVDCGDNRWKVPTTCEQCRDLVRELFDVSVEYDC